MSNKIPVLFMDDELEERAELKEAVALLNNNGCIVKECKTMSEAFKCYCENYYRVMILDIDMTGIEDPDVAERNGGVLARAFRGLNSSTAIIMYTNGSKGTDVFKLSRYGISGYIHKRLDGPEKLKELVLDKASEPISFLPFPTPKKSGKIALCLPEPVDNKNNGFIQKLMECLNRINENFFPELVDINKINENIDDYAVILIATESAFTKKMPDVREFKKKIKSIVKERKAHVVLFAKEIKYDYLNLSVFRIVENKPTSWATELSDAIQDAAYWYGMNEVIDSEKKYFQPLIKNIDFDKFGAINGD